MKLKKFGLLAIAAVAVVGVTSCGGSKEGVGRYTYNSAASVFPTNWNPHTYQTATDAVILDYTVSGFYEFDYNDARDGYAVVPAMAKSAPVDVSSDYEGDDWGIKENETGRAWKIDLRDDLKWEDGTAITADDFVKSAELLLNPDAQNYRADSLYSGNMVVSGSRDYLYQGSHAYVPNMISAAYGDDEYVAWDAFTTDAAGHLITPDGQDVALKLTSGGNWGNNSLNAYYNAGYFKEGAPLEAAADNFARLQAAANPSGEVVLTKALAEDLIAVIAALQGKTLDDYKASAGDYAYLEWQEMCFLGFDYPEFSFDKVGVKNVDGDLVLILEKELSGFYLLYNLTSTWLVHEETYTRCATTDTNGIYQNSYGTAADKYMSYGPYKLTFFQTDSEIRFERNDNWYGYNDETDVPIYQTTDVNIKYVPEASTRLQMFEKGELDSYTLQANDVADYSASDYLYYTEGASTFFIALNPNQTALKDHEDSGYDKEIFSVLEFRQALSFAVDRAAFCLACDPTGKVATGVFNSLIVSDPENGTTYRSLEGSKDVLLAFWGLTDEVGPGKRYATKDEAIASITGVSLAQARELFNVAYDKAIAAGLMTANDKVAIKIGLPNSTTAFYQKGYDYLVKCWTDAVQGTKLEGKLEFSKDDTLGNNFADGLRDNNVDVLFGVGWQGSALDPYNLVSAYTLPSYQYDPAINYAAVDKDITFATVVDVEGTVHNNVTLRASVYDWSVEALAGEVIDAVVVVNGEATDEVIKLTAGSKSDLTFRAHILNACEGAILEQYTMLPLNEDASASLKGAQIKYFTEEYIFGVGRGGIKYMTYYYDDADWAKYISSQGGTLNYK